MEDSSKYLLKYFVLLTTAATSRQLEVSSIAYAELNLQRYNSERQLSSVYKSDILSVVEQRLVMSSEVASGHRK